MRRLSSWKISFKLSMDG